MKDAVKKGCMDVAATSTYAAEARRLGELLPTDIRKPWFSACREDVIVDDEETINARRSRKPTALITPAYKCMIVSGVLRVLEMGAKLSPPVAAFSEIVEQATVERLLAGPLGEKGPLSQVILLRGIAAMAERALMADVPHIWRAARRLKKRASRRIRLGRQRKFDDYWEVAFELAPFMEVGDQHDLETALQSRHAATLGLGLEKALRRYELAGLKMENVVIDYEAGVVDLVVTAALRKSGSTFSGRLSPAVAELMIDYVQHARPFLIKHGGRGDTDWLWISRKGGRLCPEGVVSTLRRQVERVLGVTACCNIFRRATASREDIKESETFLYLQQARGSVVGQDIYAERDRAKAQGALITLWANIVA